MGVVLEEKVLHDFTHIGSDVYRKESWDKVTGAAKYNDDEAVTGVLYGIIVKSTCAHAKIVSIDSSIALKSPGVQSVVTGEYFPVLTGPIIQDMPPIAVKKVRYYGEPVAVVVANSEAQAAAASKLVRVEYEPLPVLNSIRESLSPGAPMIHENLGTYKKAVPNVSPEKGSNISNRVRIRKGDMAKGWSDSAAIVDCKFSIPQRAHASMETRNARAEIHPDGKVVINTASQAPFSIKKMISKHFGVEEGNVVVKVPLVGGGFGGKVSPQLEMIAYIASKSANGRPVKIADTREDDLVTSPCTLGLEARVRLGASRDGIINAAEITYMVDGGAYADIAPRMAKAMAIDCTGPYNIENVWCDSICVYTNHTFATSFRGFGHGENTFCIERAIDKLAHDLKMDPLEVRYKNAISPGHFTPTQVKVTESNTGNLKECIKKLRMEMKWDGGIKAEGEGNIVKAKGISCFWKTSNSPPDASSGVILNFNSDGSINLNFGAVECGPGMRTTAAQILAEKMKMDINRIHVGMDVNTETSPEHWKTVASMTTFMAGRAVLDAAEDLISQLKSIAAVALRCPIEDLEVGGEKVYLKDDPANHISFKDIASGYKYPNGNSVGGQIIGRGSYIMRHLSYLDKSTGKGKPGPSWSVGAQGVEVEYDTKKYTYRILKAVTIIDAGTIINHKTARGVVMGGMCMGLGMAACEELLHDNSGKVENSSFRTYKLMRFGEEPEYLVEFVETPQTDAPFGARGLGEHGLLGMPGALANALSAAADVDFDELPITPEVIWRKKRGGKNDPI